VQQSITTNTLFYGDNLAIMREYIPDESVGLVYLQRLAETLNHRTLRLHESLLPNRQLRAIGRRMKGQAHTCSR
jgi:hypothetical protein